MKRQRHFTDVVTYIDQDRPEIFAQQRRVVDISETIRYRDAFTSANRNSDGCLLLIEVLPGGMCLGTSYICRGAPWWDSA